MIIWLRRKLRNWLKIRDAEILTKMHLVELTRGLRKLTHDVKKLTDRIEELEKNK